jgi:hypothetical protein
VNADELQAFEGLTEAEFLEKARHLTAGELQAVRRLPVCHDNELVKGTIRVPDRTTGSSQPSRLTCVLFVMVLPVVLVIIYLLEVLGL